MAAMPYSSLLEGAQRAQFRREQLLADAAYAQKSLAELDRLQRQQEADRQRAASRQIFLMGQGRERYHRDLGKAPGFDSSPAAPIERHKLRPFRRDIL